MSGVTRAQSPVAQRISGFDGIAALRAAAPVNGATFWLRYHTSEGDDGGGRFRCVTGAAPGTYTDDGGVVILPSGGDGSACFYRENVNGKARPEWFGAACDFDPATATGTDDTAAIEKLLAFVTKPFGPYLAGGLAIELPAADIKVTKPVLSYRAVDQLDGPVKWKGQGGQSSRLWLVPPSASEVFFYDGSGAYTAGYGGDAFIFNVFEDIGFEAAGTNSAYASLMRFNTDTGHEQGFKFLRCHVGMVNGLRRGLVVDGTTNESECAFIDCYIRNTKVSTFEFNNLQSVNLNLVGTAVEKFEGSAFNVTTGGGGDVNVFGGSLIGGEGTGNSELLTVAGSSSVNHFFNFFGTRYEMRNDKATILTKTNATGAIFVNFIGAKFLDNTATADYVAVTLNKTTQVTFRDCVLPNKAQYQDDTASGAVGDSNVGSVVFEGGIGPHDLNQRIIRTNGFGMFRARGVRPYGYGGGFRAKLAMDFDIGWEANSLSGAGLAEKWMILMDKGVAWPYQTGGGGGASDAAFDSSALLPEGAVITGFKIHKPANGASAATYQLHVGSADHVTVHASSTSGQQNAAHTIDVDLTADKFIHVGTDANLRQVTMWADPGGDTAYSNITGQVVLVKYL